MTVAKFADWNRGPANHTLAFPGTTLKLPERYAFMVVSRFNNNLEIGRYAVKIKDARRANDRTVNIFEDLNPPQDIGVKSGGFISISFIVEYV